jgi:hypothetical protein
VNPAGAAFLGTTVDALLGRDYRELYPEAEGTAFQQAYARVMRTQVAESIDEHYPVGALRADSERVASPA